MSIWVQMTQMDMEETHLKSKVLHKLKENIKCFRGDFLRYFCTFVCASHTTVFLLSNDIKYILAFFAYFACPPVIGNYSTNPELYFIAAEQI